ncbi:unnamed protein product [Durusdinium trenchii]|uniref:Rad21/Rec8-like protein N-terminal domain-containing protein n=1 Tax=Durusdinium trenchii TaxID=1381693 RepID=A0ABP0SBM2_9DINO
MGRMMENEMGNINRTPTLVTLEVTNSNASATPLQGFKTAFGGGRSSGFGADAQLVERRAKRRWSVQSPWKTLMLDDFGLRIPVSLFQVSILERKTQTQDDDSKPIRCFSGLIYENLEKMKKFEPKYRLKRAGLGGEKSGPGRRAKKDTKNRMKKARGKEKAKDYLETDLRTLLQSISLRRSLVSLRATGHLLVGACKIYVKKCTFFEEEAEEVRTALMMAFSRPSDAQEDMAPQIREVRTHTAPPDQALLGGKRHMARIEDITLKDSGRTSIPSVSLQENDDLFGSLSQIELEEVMRAVRKRVLPKSALEELDSKTSINDLDFDTLPLVALSDKPQVEEEEDVQMLGDGEEDVMPMDLNAGIEDEATPAPSAHTPALHTSPILLGAAHTSPIPLQGEDDLDQVAAQAALQLVPFPNPVVARQLLTLGEEERQAVLTFFPAPRREEVQILLDQAPDPNAPASARAAYARYQAPEPLPLEPGATVAAPFERYKFKLISVSNSGSQITLDS